jgi:hypothetical protein
VYFRVVAGRSDYWPIKAYYVAVAGGSNAMFWGSIAMAIITQLIALAFLYRLFQQRILRA